MDLNLSKQQYQQYAEGGTFQPVQTTELSSGMQREYELYGRDLQKYYDAKQYNDKINILNADIRAKDLGRLADYSQTLASDIAEVQEKRNEAARKEEYSRMYQQGVPEQDMAKYREDMDAMEKAYAEGNYTKAKMIEQGIPWLITNKIDELSGWRKVGAVQGLTESLATNQYPVAQQEFIADLEQRFPGMSTPEKQRRLNQWRQQWMSSVGFDRTNPALLEDKAFPSMRRQDAAAIGQWITADENRAKDNLEEEGLSLMATNPVGNYSRAQDYFVATGRYTRAQARQKALSQVNDLNTLDDIAESVSWDKKTLNGDKYKKDFDQRRVDMLREAQGRRDYDEGEKKLAAYNYGQQNVEAWKKQRPTADTVEKAIEFSRQTYGYVDPQLEQWQTLTTDARSRKKWDDYLARRLANGTLSQALLNDPAIPWDIADKYRKKVPNAGELNKTTDANIRELTNQLSRNISKEGLTDDQRKTYPGLALAEERAQALYLKRRQENINSDAFATTADAEDEARQYVSQLILNGNPEDKAGKTDQDLGVFAFDQEKGYYIFTQPNKGLQATRAAGLKEIKRVDGIVTSWAGQGKPVLELFNNVQLLTDAQIDDAIQNSSGYGWQPSGLAEYLSAKTGGRLSAWEITERQAQRFRGQGITIPSAIRAADEQIPPEHKSALNTFPSYNRTMRASASTNTFMPRTLPQNLGTEVERVAEENGLDPALLAGVVSYETKNFSGDFGSNVNAIEKTAPLLATMIEEHGGDVTSALTSMSVGRGQGFEASVLRNATRYGYNSNGNVFRSAHAMNPALVYITGNIGPTSTGPHLDVKRTDRSFFNYTDLDEYVVIDDPDLGRVPLSEVRETGDWKSHTNRGSHGRDYGTANGTKVYLKNGAKVVSQVPTEHGLKLTIQLPTGEQYTFLHGSAPN